MSKVVKNEKNLTKKEAAYLRIIQSRPAVLYLKGVPGSCKSAILTSLAEKMGWHYLDLRLSTIAETDVGVFPIVNDATRNTSQPTFNYGIPHWALMANTRPTLIHFEELNRSLPAIRNACLGILNERRVGGFQLNDNVFMVASGNLGEEDGCDTEEFDRAMNGRLVHKKHMYPWPEWKADYAGTHLHSIILDYLNAHSEELYKVSENSPAYASHRSWTNLSNYLKVNLEEGYSAQDALSLLQEDGSGYVGPSVTKLLRYIEENSMISIEDVLNRFDEVEKSVKSMSRGRISELLQSMRTKKCADLKDKQAENLVAFLKLVGEDERMAYILYVLDKEIEHKEKAKIPEMARAVVKPFKEAMTAIMAKGQTPAAAPEEKKEEPKKGLGRPKKNP
jgi:hypothetical protein